jgi:hypothetical protein
MDLARVTGAVTLRLIIILTSHLRLGFLGHVFPSSFTRKSSTRTSYLG